MYQVVVTARFSAMHSIQVHDGAREPMHGHDWRVRVTFARPSLDALGMVIDFADARKAVRQVVGRLQYAILNELPEFQGKNPTTEVVAQWILERVLELGIESVVRVEVTEAPGCRAVFVRNFAAPGPTEDQT